MEYSLQQYAAMTQAQLFNGNQHPEQQQQQQQQQQQSQLQDPNSGYSLAYPPFPLIRMAPPQLHQPTLAKEMPTTPHHVQNNTTPTISPNTITNAHTTNTSTSHNPSIEDLGSSHNDRILSPVTPIRVTRPPNAYLLFNKEMRKILKDQDPTMKVADISKEVGSRWKNMPKEQKDQYVNQANKLKEEQRALHPNSMYIRRSRAELVKAGHLTKRSQQGQQKQDASPGNSSGSNLSSGSIEQHRSTDPYPTQQLQHKRKKNKRDKNSNIPKHPLSPYMWYLTEVRPETMRNFPGSNVGQISKLCADRWNTMSEEARSPWNSKAQIDKDRYAREMQVYALQNDQNLGRGTRHKYRTAALRDTASIASSATSTITKTDHHQHHHASTNTTFDTNSVVPIFYTPDGKQHLSLYHHQSSGPESPNSILQNSLPMTLNPNALLQHHHNNSNNNGPNDPYGNH